MSRLQEIQASLTEQLEAMSARDRNLLTGLICALGLVLAGGVTWTLQGVLEDRASRVVDAKENLLRVQELAAEHAGLQARITAAEARMAQFRPTQMNTYLASWATEAGVGENLRGVRETGTQTVGAYRERDYSVEVQRADLQGVVKFLHAIETSEFPIEVRSARFKVAQVREDRFIDLDLELVSFSKEDEG